MVFAANDRGNPHKRIIDHTTKIIGGGSVFFDQYFIFKKRCPVFINSIAAVFIAQVFGIDLTLGQQLTIVLTATLASIGSPGIPSGSIVMLIIVLNSVGLPVEGLALILGVDRPLDMLRTVVNITGDSTVSSVVARSEGELSKVS